MTNADQAGRRPYEYFVIRCVPRVDRGECVNVGVVLYCQDADFLAARTELPRERLAAMSADLDLDAVAKALATVDAVCRGDATAGAAALGSLGKRFGWLAAPRSTVLQPSPVHGGLTADPAAEIDRLLSALVR